MIVLGLDIGTTVVKGMAFDKDGGRVGSSSREYPLQRPRPGHYELDSLQMSKAIREVIQEVVKSAGRGRIRAVASSALGEAVLPIDGTGNPLYNTIVALDHRAVEQATALAEIVSPADFFRLTGQSLHPIASICKILWWREREPEVFSRADKFVCWNDMLAVLLGLEPSISPSLAARTGLYDLRQGEWSEKLLEVARLRSDQMARIRPTGEVVGRVSAGAAESLGLAKDCVYVSGGWDQVCAALGSGAVDEGIAVNSMGSTDSLNATYLGAQTSEAMLKGHFTCTPAAIEALYCTNAFSMGGGNLLTWFRDHLDKERAESLTRSGRDYFGELVSEALRSDNPVLLLPHFAGSGTPHMDPDSKGAMLGLTLATRREDIAAGILEGIAQEMAINLEALEQAGIPIRKVFIGGGGARSAELVQLRANVFDRPVTPLDVEEAGCLACGLLAVAALDSSTSILELAESWIRAGTPVEPQPAQAARYRQKRGTYTSLYPVLRAFFSGQQTSV